MGCSRDDVRGEFRDRDRGCGCGGRGCNSCGGGGDVGGESRNCVKDTVRRILEAQREVAGSGLHDCRSSCERSIEDLISPGRERAGRHTTIPFMLTCRHTCSTYYGSGFCGNGGDLGRHGNFECVESPIFKVQGFVRGSNNCVRLELLLPENHHGPDAEGDFGGHHDKCGSVCKSVGHRFRNLRRTGVCITVDLDCFCAISCLPATTPREFD